jgi:hypothetical protein
MIIPQKMKMDLQFDPAVCLLDIQPKEIGNTPKRYLYAHVIVVLLTIAKIWN